MAKIAGKLQTLEIDDGGGFVTINGIVDATLNGEVDQLDSTTHDNVNSRTFIPNRFSGTIDGTLKWDEADAGQVDVMDSFLNKTTVSYRFRMQTGTGFYEFTASGNVNTFNASGPNDDVAEIAFTIQITGDLTRATQP